MKKYFIGILFAVIFFVVGLLTLSNYGLNWDEPNHFMRGQALLYFLGTREKSYDNLDVPRRSQWQNDQQNGVYYFDRMKATHPTLNDIFAAFTNYVFYQKLGWVGDLQAYHLFEVFVSSLLVFLVFYITSSNYGKFAGIISALSLSLYPLFLGESRFNIKDPIEASFFSFSVFFIYLALNEVKYIYFLLAGVFFAFAAGTKFNAFFIPFVFLPYILIRFFPDLKKFKLKAFQKIPKKFYLFSIFAIFISILIYIYFNPMLWNDPIGKFLNEQVKYYKSIGTGINYTPAYLFHGFNLYPLFFIAISTPLIILFLSIIGILWAIKRVFKEKKELSLLILLWFLVPIIRVTVPGSSVYNGSRQIMEYVPAMALLAGLGANGIGTLLQKIFFKILKKSKWVSVAQIERRIKIVIQLFIIFLFLPLASKVVQLHPNENVFMNSLIGGLKGAVDRKVPGAGQTLGNAYLQGIFWLNQHAEQNAIYKAAEGVSSNFPKQFARNDLKIAQYFSGMDKKGEYMMEIYYAGFPLPGYKIEYLEAFLDPVYIYKVDGVPLLKLWKNDIQHTKKGFINEKVENNIKTFGEEKIGSIKIILQKPAFITRVGINHGSNNCSKEMLGSISYSLDDKIYRYASNGLADDQGYYASTLQNDSTFVYFFSATPAKYIQIIPSDPNSCLLRYTSIYVKSLKNILPSYE